MNRKNIISLVLAFVAFYPSLSRGMEERKRKAIRLTNPREEKRKKKFDSPETEKLFEALTVEATEKLFEAIKAGDEALIRQLVNDGADINGLDTKGLTPLHRAILSQRANMVALCIELGADPNIRDRTPQEWTCGYSGNLKYPWWSTLPPRLLGSLEYALLHAGKTTLLERANRIEIIKLLIENGADLNPRDAFMTPLCVAASFDKSTDLIDLLIEQGAYVNHPNCKGIYPLSFACAYARSLNVTMLLNKGANPHVKSTEYSRTMMPLENILHEIMKSGANLSSSIEFDSAYIIYLLLSFGANIKKLNPEQAEFLKLLLPKLGEKFTFFQSPIIQHLATRSPNVVQAYTTELTLDPNQVRELFLFAIGQGCQMMAYTMIEKHPEFIGQDFLNTAFIRSAQFGYDLSNLYRTLKPDQTTVNTAFMHAVQSCAANNIKFLFHTGLIVPQTHERVILQSIKYGMPAIIKLLVECKVISPKNIAFLLKDAAEFGNASVMKYLHAIAQSFGTPVSKHILEEALLKGALRAHIDIVRNILAIEPSLDAGRTQTGLIEMLESTLSDDLRKRYEEILEMVVEHHAHLSFLPVSLSAGASVEQPSLTPEIVDLIRRCNSFGWQH